MLDSISWKFVRVCGSEDDISLKGGRDDLADDVFVGESDHKSVLWGVVLGLVLGHQSLSGVVVGFSLSSSSEGGLVSGQVCALVCDECHFVLFEDSFWTGG